MTPFVLNKTSPFVSYRQLRACTCIHLPTHTCIRFLPSAFRIRRRFGLRVAHGVPFDDPGSASMALEASWAVGRAMGGVRGAVRAEKNAI